MVTLDNLTKFSGEDGEDAFRWYRNFLDAVGPLGERGMLNHFPLYMEPDSLAQMWCDELPKEVLSSWTDVDRNFRRTWLCNGEAKVEAMERFLNHHLTEDAIFTSTSADIETMNRVIVEWAENHAKLGDAALVQATLPNLPVFIRAFLKYKSTPPKTFRELCTRIKEIEDHILEFEQLRRQEKGAEWQTKSEKKQDDPKVVESNEVNVNANATLFFPPVESQVTDVLPNKAEMVDSVREAIVTLRKYKPSEITIDAACMIDIGLLHYCKTVSALDQFLPNTITGKAGIKSTVWLGLYQINYIHASNELGAVPEVTRTWESITNSHIAREGCIYRSHHTQVQPPDTSSPQAFGDGSSEYDGGLIQFGNKSSTPYMWTSAFGTAVYFLLSVSLAEHFATGNSTYQQAAIDGANWIIKWAYNEGTYLVKNFTRDLWNSVERGPVTPSPHVTGLFITGLCVLASVSGEQKWRTLATNICDAAMVYKDWHNDDGVFKYLSASGASTVDDSNVFRGLLIRGLSAAYQRNPDDNRLRNAIRSYVNVQFNALRNITPARGSYPVAWNALSSELHAHGQIAALDVLMAAVVVNHY